MRPMLQWARFLPRHRAVPSRAAQAVGADSDHGKEREVFGTVTTYEILLMLDPEGAEAHQDDLIARVRDLVEKGGGTWRSHDAWGRRRLAYEIAKKPEGVYHLVVFESGPETLDEISRTSAPRDEFPAPAAAAPSPAPVAPAEPEPVASEEPEPEPVAVAAPE